MNVFKIESSQGTFFSSIPVEDQSFDSVQEYVPIEELKATLVQLEKIKSELVMVNNQLAMRKRLMDAKDKGMQKLYVELHRSQLEVEKLRGECK